MPNPVFSATRSAIQPNHATSAIIVMGVSGCGKSSVGQQLATQLNWRFADADTYHPAANVQKMSQGFALNDDDRAPWLERLNAVLRHSVAKQEPIVLACSALKQRYRDALGDRLNSLAFVHLSGSFDLIEARLKQRPGHYMPTSLLQSQFAALEAPSDVLTLDISESITSLVSQIVALTKQ